MLRFCRQHVGQDAGRERHADLPELPRRQLCDNAMMKNRVYETTPRSYGASASIPTLLGTMARPRKLCERSPDGTQRQSKLRRLVELGLHPDQRRDQHEGARSSKFVASYGFFVKMAVTTTPPSWFAQPATNRT